MSIPATLFVTGGPQRTLGALEMVGGQIRLLVFPFLFWLKRKSKKNLGVIFLGVISLWGKVILSPKIISNLSRTFEKLHCKRNHIVLEATEILRYRQTQEILFLLYKDTIADKPHKLQPFRILISRSCRAMIL